MQFLLDMPVSPTLLDVLRAHGDEGVHAYQIGKDRASDSELLATARQESRVVITADLDTSLCVVDRKRIRVTRLPLGQNR